MKVKYNATLTKVYKKIIRQKGLIDTRLMIDTIKVYAGLQGNKLLVKVVAVEYHQYQVEPYGFYEAFTSDPEFNEEIANIYAIIIDDAVNDILEGNVPNFVDYDLDVQWEFF